MDPGCALLAVHHARRGHDLAAAGFLVFVVAEAQIVSLVAVHALVVGFHRPTP